MRQHKKPQRAVLASLVCQEATHRVRVELRLHRYDDVLHEIIQHDEAREAEIEHGWEAILTQVISEARRRGGPHPFSVVVLAGPSGPLQRGPLPWEQSA